VLIAYLINHLHLHPLYLKILQAGTLANGHTKSMPTKVDRRGVSPWPLGACSALVAPNTPLPRTSIPSPNRKSSKKVQKGNFTPVI
jgi:hypothetical protein